MGAITREELRLLSRHATKAHAWAALATLGCLALVPVALLAEDLFHLPRAAVAFAATLAGGALLVRFAFEAGRSKGAFRRTFRRLREEEKTSRASARPPGEGSRRPEGRNP